MPCTTPKFALLGRDSCAGSTGELRSLTSSRTSTSGTTTHSCAAPLPECLETFWTAPEPPAASAIPAPEPTAPDALLDELDPLPVKIQGKSAVELLRPVYRAMARS
ncbi:hypothetical protein [Saccharopolyspora sp. ASAGF58]|uniref:hypothetical protein n=1 Tax=Saccharopolyspora sp. ASAGF58 TaxID=2719023 RepID=UPI001B300532|nr:hypothetical protein [Saccharopolyspora sp. ASAGF58]